MAIKPTDGERALGQANYADVSGELNRRGFMKSMAVATAAAGLGGAAAYYGYKKLDGKPIKAAIIGCGDEGCVLVGEHNPEYLEFVAICDIRPSNRSRVFDPDKEAPQLRRGLKHHYGADCDKKIKQYTDYKEMLASEKEIEAVVIATPLISHAPIAIDCLNAGKHVLCEKLMARTIGQCKEMIKVAEANNRILSIGHQRHYSLLYAQATEVIAAGVLGDIKHIRALWHRNFSWPLLEGGSTKYNPDTGEPIVTAGKQVLDQFTNQPLLRDGWSKPILKEDFDALKDTAKKYGYKDVQELIRWRLYNRTGGGLMAELGSHQLDAASIFLGKVHPLSVTGVGTHGFYGRAAGDGKPNPREIDDHVFATYEFPGKNHPKGANGGKDETDIVVVTYSSISTNGFEDYGECLMGTRGTMLVEKEQTVMLYTEADPAKKIKGAKTTTAVISTTPGGKPVVDSGSTWGGPSASAAPTAGGSTAPTSRGYKEEMEDFAYCIKMWNQGTSADRRLPRCHGKVAMADAIVALTSNLSMRDRRRIEFDDAWFDPKDAKVPDADLKFETV